MIMGFRWLVNAGLIAIPIGTTVGVLMGIDSHRSATGQTPLFTGDGGSDYGGGSGSGSGSGSPSPKPGDNGITETQYCQKELAISPPSKGVQYTRKQFIAWNLKFHIRLIMVFQYINIFSNGWLTSCAIVNPNPWGWTPGDPGTLCMNVCSKIQP
jgi:hypothetical protein